jgi:hypothetical protein
LGVFKKGFYADVLELSFDVDILAILGLTTVSATFSKNRQFFNLLDQWLLRVNTPAYFLVAWQIKIF